MIKINTKSEAFMKKFFVALLILLTCTFFLSLTTHVAAAENKNLHNALLQQGYIAIPLKTSANGYLFVEAAFGNNNHYPLLLDTGSAHTTLDPKMMAFFNFPKTGKTKTGGGGGGFGSMYYQIIIPVLQLGNFIDNHENAYIANYSFNFFNLNHELNAGILGIDFLRKHSAIIDVDHKTLYLQSTKNQTTTDLFDHYQNILLDAGYSLINLEYSPHNFSIIAASINHSKSAPFFLDSGCNPSLLALDFVTSQNLPLMGSFILEKGSDGVNMKMYRVAVERLSVGSVMWSPNIILATDFHYTQAGVGMPVVGVLGIDWMRDQHAILDLGDNKIFVK
jgi:hypothetical protein